MAGFAMLMAAGGTIMNIMGQRQAMATQANMNEYNARILENQAKAQRAKASMDAENRIGEANYLESRAQAAAGHSGGGAVPELQSRIYSQGLVNSGNEVVQGEVNANATTSAASLQRYAGSATRAAIPGAMIGGLLTGASQIAQIGMTSGYNPMSVATAAPAYKYASPKMA